MAEYIEREALLKEVDDLKKSPWYNDDYGFGTKQARHDGVNCVVNLCIKQAPTADVVEVVHGKWEPIGVHGFDCFDAKCSVCGYADVFDESGLHKFCPECGAKMDAHSKPTLPETTRQTVLDSFMKGSED